MAKRPKDFGALHLRWCVGSLHLSFWPLRLQSISKHENGLAKRNGYDGNGHFSWSREMKS